METLRKQESAQKPAITKPAPAHIAIRYFMVPLLNSAGEWRGRVGPSSAGDSRMPNLQPAVGAPLPVDGSYTRANADDSFSDDNDSGVGLRVCTRRVDYGDLSYDDCTIRHLRPCGSTDQQEHEQEAFPHGSSRWLNRSLTRWAAARFPPRLSCDSPPIISAATISRGVPMPDPPAPLTQR
jgi:hypothetical protein